MNTLGKWSHIIQRANRCNEFNNLELAKRGMAGVTTIYSLHNGQQTINFRRHNEGVLLDCVSASKLHGGKGTLKAQGNKCFSKSIFNDSQLYKSLVISRFLASCHGSTVHPFKQTLRQSHNLSREWLAQLWHEEKKRNFLKRRRYYKHSESASPVDSLDWTSFTSFRIPSDVPPASVHPGPEAQPGDLRGPPVQQPSPSQSLVGILKPTCPEEVKIAPLLARANLLITREVEWANLVFSFEQENRYAIVDPTYSQTPVGFIREQSNVLMRQILRTRRYFTAFMTDAMGNELFRVRRPPWLINSTIYVEINGKEIGVVHRRWHLWRRIYDLYLGKNQFAVVENAGFWDWTFTLKDENGNTLAEIDRDWRGFGFEMFTDAGQYAIRFGNTDSSAKTGLAAQIHELDVYRPLSLSERAITVALAVSLDNDYFSRHSGWGFPIIPFWSEE
ncbi:uncharacterized protein LOC131078677 isoform X1 [Cryptomeria japonica]|uniref:uncharacterized protein LOC131078677 isoform X1 n=1 Tax=Cryptomeria japonica TaxID=3369 RepID=UPI0027DAA163|nr:uncharacterized protein LOC131078677 isoform X1 [Cryptomeria japonica]XP_057872412.2 uncharacterized protein LOC131078677 isoform X1 [Cryptomeria japonica]